jgi:NADPH:quinone reductase-like Zn-dependent oxidoreductase
MDTPDIVELSVVLIGIALIYFRPKFFLFVNLTVAALIGVIMFIFSQRAGNVTPVSGTALVDGRHEMRAAIYQLGAGEHDVLVSPNVPIPTSHNDREVLVRVSDAGLNPSNFKLNKAWLPFLRHFIAPVVGYDVAGVVVSAGKHSECSKLIPGTRVFGISGGGAMAEFAVVTCSTLTVTPAGLSDKEAAGITVTALTSLMAMHRGNVGPGSRVVVVGASGGCGIYGVKLAKAIGAHVTGICSTRNVDFVRGLGADDIVDYLSDDAMAALRAKPAGTFDAVYDTVTSFAPEDPNYEPVVGPLLAPGGKGRYEAINGVPADWLRAMADQALDVLTGGRTRGLLQRPGYDLFLLVPTQPLFDELVGYFHAGKLDGATAVDSEFPLTTDGLNGGFARIKSRRAVGKIIIHIADNNNKAAGPAGGAASDGAAAATAPAGGAGGEREL